MSTAVSLTSALRPRRKQWSSYLAPLHHHSPAHARLFSAAFLSHAAPSPASALPASPSPSRPPSVWSHLSGSLDAAPLDFSSIPIINLAPLLPHLPHLPPTSSPSSSPHSLPTHPPSHPTLSSLPPAARATISALHSACTLTGFFYLTNHSIPPHLLRTSLASARTFFAQPLSYKLRSSCTDTPNRGYFTIGQENLGDKDVGDYKEGMDIGIDRKQEGEDPQMQGGNRWPQGLPGFREAMDAHFEAMMGLSRQLTSALALALDIPPATFDAVTRAPMASLRLTHYPPQPAHSVNEQHLGAGPHTDYGLLTVVCEDREGLEVRNRRGEWVRCPHVDGALVINLGDMMQRMTGGLYRSTPHRVINRVREGEGEGGEGEEGEREGWEGGGLHHRFSLPFFYEPDISSVIRVVPELVGRAGVAHYEPVVFGDHLRAMYELTYKKTQQTQSSTLATSAQQSTTLAAAADATVHAA